MIVTALKSFEHNGTIKRGAEFECSEIQANALKRAGLVSFDEETPTNPTLAGASLPSALPPVLPSPQTTAKPLDAGAKVKTKPGRKKKL